MDQKCKFCSFNDFVNDICIIYFINVDYITILKSDSTTKPGHFICPSHGVFT